MTDEGEKREAEPASLYWVLKHSTARLEAFYKKNRALTAGIFVALLFLIFTLRGFVQPVVLGARKNLFVLLAALVVLWIWRRVLRISSPKGRITGLALCLLVIAGGAIWGRRVHGYLSLYYRYSTLALVDLEQLPVTGFERIQPLNSVYSLAHEVMTETESPSRPDFVRVGGDYRWTIAIEPAYPIGRVFGAVTQLLAVSGTAASPNFSKQNRVPVNFEAGENLMLSHNSMNCSIKRFGLWRFLNYEPAEVMYFTDDKGEWIQVVSLIRWSGFFFPRPEFGGVQIIRQRQPSLAQSLERVFFGIGEWVKPEEVSRYGFLRGQNLLPQRVSRQIAQSLRFQEGFWGPLPGYHRGDVRIPDLATDVNNQPFTTYFEGVHKEGGGLFQYFGLEPFDPDKQGLNTSLFLPADGSPRVYVYRHYAKSGSITGVSAISAKVMESKKNFDWSRNRPVEHRPFIRNFDGVNRFFWLTTVVTFKEQEGGSQFIAGSTPDVVLTDAVYNTPVWVDARRPETWLQQIKQELAVVWGR